MSSSFEEFDDDQEHDDSMDDTDLEATLELQQKSLEVLLNYSSVVVSKDGEPANELAAIARSYEDLGRLHEQQGNPRGALRNYRLALEYHESSPSKQTDDDMEIDDEVSPRDSPTTRDMIQLYRSVARVQFRHFFQHEKAQVAIQKAIDLAVTASTTKKDDDAVSRKELASLNQDMAHLLTSQGDFDGALTALKPLLDSTNDDDEVLTTLAIQEQMADILFSKGDFKGAEKEYLKIIEARENGLGKGSGTIDNNEDNQDVLRRLYRAMGCLLYKKKDDNRGDQYFQKAATLTTYQPLFVAETTTGLRTMAA
ncbi:expressed unknown protein [Seminavis robusta]|uniref:Uncharacterized protein n=1 Tax=Seminavis robusta TaxID=568900 RepID=A0A9N8EQF7_9STRA|nr:expressed unknown protein [Seminavis robusta]|eukprot:Sro1438_g272660.1 n/a (311) ;mRNA; f:9025-9957